MVDNRGKRLNSTSVVKEKMKVLDDFGICDKNDKSMIAKLERVVKDHPEKDPREALDYYCRPMIQAKVNSWN